ncbi:hypothetical protein [Rubritalea tangerina]
MPRSSKTRWIVASMRLLGQEAPAVMPIVTGFRDLEGYCTLS